MMSLPSLANCYSVRSSSGATQTRCTNPAGGAGVERQAYGDARRNHHGIIREHSSRSRIETFGGIQSYTQRPGYPAPRVAPGDTYIRRGNHVFRIHHEQN